MYSRILTKIRRNVRRSSSLVGCELHSDRVSLAQLESSRDNRLSLRKASCILTPFEEGVGPGGLDAARVLKDCVAEANIRGRDVVVSMPEEHVSYRKVRIARVPDDETRSVIQWQVAKELNKSRDSLCIDYCPIPYSRSNNNKYQEVMAYVSQRETIDRLVGMLATTGLNPVAVDLGPAAFARCLRMVPGNEESSGYMLYLEVGCGRSGLYLLHDGNPVFLRHFHYSQSMIDSRVRSVVEAAYGGIIPKDAAHGELGVDGPGSSDVCDEERGKILNQVCRAAAKDMVHDIKLCVRYLKDVGMIDDLSDCRIVVSAGAYEKSILESFDGLSDVKFAGTDGLVPPDIREAMAECGAGDEWLRAIGLCLYSTQDSMIGVCA